MVLKQSLYCLDFGIELKHESSSGSVERLRNVVAFLVGRYGMLYEDIESLTDYKGRLTVKWRLKPSDAKMEALVDAWKYVDEHIVEHVLPEL